VSKNEELGLPFGDGMEKVAFCFDVDGTLIDEDTVIQSSTLDILRAFAFQKWKNVDVIVWSGGGADYARMQYGRITKNMDERYVKFHSKLEHTELRKKYARIIAVDDIQDTRLGDVNLIVRNK
jgi:phosphoglycolate phosphatase-like HAD superfamily hydrolase